MADSDLLPEGWIVEVKLRMHGRKDKYYTDPTRRYTFQSRRDALRFSQTGELGKYAKSNYKNNTNREKEKDKTSSPVVEGQILADSSTTTEVSQNKVSILKVVQNEKTIESTYSEKSSKVFELVENQCKQGSATSYISQSEAGTLKQSGLKGESIMPEAEEILPDSSGLSKSKCRRRTDLPRRTSKRLAGIQISQPLETETKIGTRSASHVDEVEGNIGELVKKTETDITKHMKLDPMKHTIIGNVEESVGKIKTENTTKKQKTGETIDRFNKQSNKKPTDFPRRTSNRLAGIDISTQLEHSTPTRGISSKECSVENVRNKSEVQESSTAVILSVTNQSITPEPSKTVEEETRLPMEALLKEIWMDPCFQFAVKTLTGAIPIDDHHLKVDKIPQPPTTTSNPPFSKYPWDEDPCFEFAVKTLTGDIGIEELQMRMCGDRESDSSVHNHKRSGSFQGQLNNKRKSST